MWVEVGSPETGFSVTDATDVWPVFHVVVMVPVGGCGPGLPLSSLSQFVASWNFATDLTLPLVTPPPLQPPTLPFEMIFGFTNVASPDLGRAGLKVATPE